MKKIKDIIKEKGYTVKEVAAMIKCSPCTIYAKNPSNLLLFAIENIPAKKIRTIWSVPNKFKNAVKKDMDELTLKNSIHVPEELIVREIDKFIKENKKWVVTAQLID